MLEITAFKGGNRGYQFSPAQRAEYLAGLDVASAQLTGRPLNEFLGEFLLVKCFFFLAMMRPADGTRPDKHVKWQYRWQSPVRDRDYLLDRHGVIFKVTGDVHPDSHYLG